MTQRLFFLLSVLGQLQVVCGCKCEKTQPNKFNLGCLMYLVRGYLLWVYRFVHVNLAAWVPVCCLFVVQIFKCEIIAQGWGNGKPPKKSRNPFKAVVSPSGSWLEQAPGEQSLPGDMGSHQGCRQRGKMGKKDLLVHDYCFIQDGAEPTWASLFLTLQQL